MLRNAMAYGAILGRPIRVIKVRAGRSKPGLAAQHLTGIQLVHNIYGGDLTGACMKSQEFSFRPPVSPKFIQCQVVHAEADTKTAGSVMLVLQTALVPLLFLPCPAQLLLKGGTDAEMAPPVNYAIHVLCPMLVRLLACSAPLLTVRKRGFFPRGGGEVAVATQPIKQLRAFTLVERGDITKVRLLVVTGGRLPRKLIDTLPRLVTTAIMQTSLRDVPFSCSQEHDDACQGAGYSILLIAETSGGCLFGSSSISGKKGTSDETTVQQAVDGLIQDLGHEAACVDRYMQDQLIIFMALAAGASEMLCGPLELHTTTAIHWAQYITGARFSVEQVPDSACFRICCEGVGFKNPYL